MSFDAENNFVLNAHVLAELWKELKSEMRWKLYQHSKTPLTERWKDMKRKYNCLWKILKFNCLLSLKENGEEYLKESIKND